MERAKFAGVYTHDGAGTIVVRYSWEQRKLGDVVKEITRNDPESEAPIMMITANNGFIEQSERYAFNNAGESLKKYILLKKGELAYNHGASKLRPYGSCFALTTAENARIPFVYHCFSAENQNAEFMSIELNGAEIENQLRRIVSSGARMDGLLNISFDEYTSVSVLLPGVEEQDRIADFFRHLDRLITLHQRKLELRFSRMHVFHLGTHADVVPGDERTRHWGARSTTPNRPKSDFAPKTWCPSTKEQGIGGSEAPRSTRRTPIWSQRRGARRRRTRFCRQHYPDIKGGNYDF